MIAANPQSRVAKTGTRVLRETSDKDLLKGRRPSRPMANINLTAPECTAKVHTRIAKITIQRKSLPAVSPSTDFTSIGNPPFIFPKPGMPRSGTAIRAKSKTSNPENPAARSACKIARGAFLRGSCVSSANVPAVSNPYST